MADEQRNHDEDMKPPREPGHAPRPATEPDGSEGSSKAPGADTDPATGESTPKARRD
jgi:hypothetical protein